MIPPDPLLADITDSVPFHVTQVSDVPTQHINLQELEGSLGELRDSVDMWALPGRICNDL